MTVALPDYYAILEVTIEADAAQLRASHKRLLKHLHPDRNPHVDPRHVALVNAAYEVLSDPEKRAVYDAQRNGALTRAQRKTGVHVTRVDVPWPDGFDFAEQERRRARQEARFKQAKEEREQEAQRKVADAKVEAARKAAELKADKELAAQRLAESRAQLKARAADTKARSERERKAQVARDTAAKVEEFRIEERKRLTRAQRRLEPSSQQAVDKFIAMIWRALDDQQLNHTTRDVPATMAGTWEVHAQGVRWQGARTSIFIPASEIEWAVKHLFRRGDLTRLTLIHRLRDPERFAEQGLPIARGLFSLLSRLPFFGVTEDPLTLHFDRIFWETVVMG